ncbi:MAG TPA: hypothetical protein VF198_10085 [Vicinamibacterales bacterium]
MTDATRHIRDVLDEVRRRWRRLVQLRFVLRAALGLAAVWALALVAWLVAGRESASVQVLLLATAAAASAGFLVLAWRARPRQPDARAFARLIEDHVPGLDDRLATAVDVLDDPQAGSLADLLLADTARRVDRADVDLVIPPATLGRTALQAAAALALLAVVGVAARGPAGAAARATLLWIAPERLAVTVTPGDARVPPDTALTIQAETGATARGLVPELVVRMDDAARSTPMQAVGADRFAVTFERVPRSFVYQVRVAGRDTQEYTVTRLEPPRIGRLDLHYTYPSFANLAPRTETGSGDIYAPEGTTVTVTVVPQTVTAPVERAWITMRDGAEIPLERDGDVFTGRLTVKGDTGYRVRLRDTDGLENRDDPEYFVRRLDDRPPDVRILRPAGDRQVTPLEEVTIEARAEDDHGVAHLELRYSVRGQEWKRVPLRIERGTVAQGGHTVYLEDLRVSPGDFVTYYAVARDIGRGKRPSEARSDIFFLEVTPFVDEFALAQSQAMANAAGGGQMDDLVRLQKDIIAGTWKLQRRAEGAGQGPPADDARTLGRAQAAVRARAETAGRQAQLFGRARGRRPGAMIPEEGGPGAALLEAARAMLRAERSLAAVKPNEALPAEMEALNHLLRAEAEQRRTEIARQQASGGGGGANRAQQDLSALFDRELRRQQETNYETPRSVEQRTGEAERDDLLDRVRELARRQEALQRQQEDLARDRDRMDEAEARRRLERLTRDQAELRRQAEKLAQEMQQQQRGAPSPSGQRADGQTGSSGAQADARQRAEALREASKEMGAAASELRREAPDAARERSARALDRLQAVERGMRSQGPDEQRRAAGDAQLEARQLADRQRQLAEETAGAGANEDARRRLAGEQQRLAERAEALRERVRRLAEAAGGGEAKDRLAEAAKRAESERIGERMREAAEQIRQGNPKAGDAQRELARALDRLADSVSGTPGGGDRESQQLAEDLSRTRELRERLEELQRQMKELGRQADAQQEGRDGRTRGRDARGRAEGESAQAGGSPEERLRRLNELQREYLETLQESGALRDRLAQASPGTGRAASTPVDQQMVTSAPGTEAFKQDFSRWERLHREITLGLERVEATLAQRAVERAARERLRSGEIARVPDGYQSSVDRYYRALAEEPR